MWFVTYVNIKIKQWTKTSELLEYMSLTNKEPVKSKLVNWNLNSPHT